jgi:heterodisulfide reductase subunit D
MSSTEQSLHDYMHAEGAAIADLCTRCGKCVEVCPVVPYGRAAGVPHAEVAANVAGFLAGSENALSAGADDWVSMCNGCGECIPACPEAINPRKMLVLAGARHATTSSRTPELFQRMARAIKVMSAMQLLPDEARRLLVPPRPRKVPIVFYLGCNAVRTPNVLFNAMTLLDAVDADYEVVGGPSSCCGVIATRWEGQIERGGRTTSNTITRFEGFEPEKVLNWCPTCQIHIGETLEGFRQTSYDFDHVTKYLVSRLDALKAKLTTPVNKRVIVHAHVGRADVCRDVDTLLRAIPGLEIIETVVESSYVCGGSGCTKAPELAAREHGHMIKRAHETGAEVLVTLYHGCHMVFIGSEKDGAFKVLNYTDLLVQALGLTPHDDKLKHYRMQDSLRAIIKEAQPFLKANGIELDDAFLEANLPAIFSGAEYRGQLDCFGS